MGEPKWGGLFVKRRNHFREAAQTLFRKGLPSCVGTLPLLPCRSNIFIYGQDLQL